MTAKTHDAQTTTQNVITLADGQTIPATRWNREINTLAFLCSTPCTFHLPTGNLEMHSPFMLLINRDQDAQVDIYGNDVTDFNLLFEAVSGSPFTYKKREHILAAEMQTAGTVKGQDRTGKPVDVSYLPGQWLVKQPNGEVHVFNREQIERYYTEVPIGQTGQNDETL